MRRFSKSTLVLGGLLLFGGLQGTATADPEIVELLPLSSADREDFATSVGVSGDVLVVGSPGQRAVHVFGRTNGRWAQRQRIVSTAAAFDAFGAAVAVDGTRILIGAPDDAGGDGRVYVYDLDRTRSSWTLRQELAVGEMDDGLAFGSDVAIDGDAFAISAPAQAAGAGAVYMFRPTLPDVWIMQDEVTPGDGAAGAGFGTAIDIGGGTMVAAAPAHDGGRGAVYVFDLSGQNWVERAEFSQPGAGDPERFGSDVDLDGDVILVGAVDAGKAYVFERRDGDVDLLAELAPTGPEPPQAFGACVALSGGSAVVADPGIAGGTGALTVFARSGDVFDLRTVIVPPNDLHHVEMGSDLAIDGALLGVAAPAGGSPDARVFAIDLLERTDGYLALGSIRYVQAPGKKRQASPGIAVTGTLDLGSSAVDLSLPGMLTIGDLSVPFGTLRQSKAKKPFVFDDGTTVLSIKPASSGTSKATFSLRHADVAGLGVDVDGLLTVSVVTADVSASGTARMTNGAYKSGKKAADLAAPFFVLDKLKVKLKTAGKSSFKFSGRLAGSGAAPEAGPTVTIRVGSFEETISGDRFKRKKSKWTFKDSKAAGVSAIVLDFAKGKVTVVAKKVSVSPPAPGPTPFAVGIDVNGVAREANVTAVAKGSSLKY